MPEFVGKCLLFGGLLGLGLVCAGSLRRRVRCLRDVLGALERLERELSFSLPPVEALLRKMQTGCGRDSLAFFEACLARFSTRGEERLEEIWSACLKESALPLREEELRLAEEIGAVLGRYDGESQSDAFRRIRDRLELCLAQAREEAGRMGRVYVVLGFCLGLFSVLLL